MRTPFKSDYRVTQAFGVNAAYYSQFGLKAHEGIDLVPVDGRMTAVLALADGLVVRDEDNPRSGSYGIYVTIWHPTLKRATQYCHLAGNTVSLGDRVTAGQQIGTMGSTGNSTGPHLHLNLFETDDNGVRLNSNNGYLGGIDPQPFLNQPGEAMATITQRELDEIRLARDTHYNDLQEATRTIQHLNGLVNDRNREIGELKRRLEEAERTRDDYKSLADTHQEQALKVPGLEEELKQAVKSRADAWAETEATRKQMDVLRAERDAAVANAPAAFLRWILGHLARR